MKNVRVLVAFLIIVFGVAYLGGRFQPGEWYQVLKKPPFTPPGWLFAPVWTLLYILIAVSGWKAWVSARGTVRIVPFTCWFFQMALNALWSFLFFGLHRLDLALAGAILLWAAIFLTGCCFWRVNRLASLLLVPYLLWVSFACVLTYSIYSLNR